MIKNILLKILAFLLLITATSITAYADDDDDEDGGRKGRMAMGINDTTAKMDVIVDNRDVYVRIIAPSQLLLGTELKPASLAEQRQYDEHIDNLKQLENIVKFTDSAKCVRLKFSQKSPNLLDSIAIKSDKKTQLTPSFDDMMAGNNEQAYIKTTVLYKVMCKKPNRLAVLTPTIFDLYDDLDQVYLRWRNNGKVGQKVITAQDKVVYLYKRPGAMNYNNMNRGEGDDDEDEDDD